MIEPVGADDAGAVNLTDVTGRDLVVGESVWFQIAHALDGPRTTNAVRT